MRLRLAPVLALSLSLACSSTSAGGEGDTDTGAGSDGTASAGSTGADGPPTTYHQHARAILDARCVGCHRDGGVGPFPLDSFDMAAQWGAAAAAAVAERIMPPFPPDDENCAPLKDFRNMEDWERDVLLDWVEGGMAEGDPTLPSEIEVDVPPDELGPPDALYPAGFSYTPDASGDDEYRCFLIDPGLTDEWTFLRSLGIDTNNWERVHHSIIYLADPDVAAAAQALDAGDAAPGWPCYFGPGVDGASAAGGYAPGAQARPYAGGTTVPIPAGTQFIVELHFHETYNEDPVEFGVAAWTFDQPVTEFPFGIHLEDFEFFIPAGAKSVKETMMGAVVADDVDTLAPGETHQGLVWAVDFHMHLLGKSARIEVVRENGDRECLLYIPDWTDDWQGFYDLAEPVALAPGDRIEATCEWDNSPEHQPVVDGEPIDPVDVYPGLDVFDEMCVANVSMAAK